MYGDDPHTHDTHIPRLHPIEALSDVGASDIFDPSQSEDIPPPPTDPNDWTLDYVKDPWIQTTCMIPNDEGSRSIHPKYTFFRNKIWLDDRMVVPASRIHEIIEQNHNGNLQGHWGGAKTAQILQRKYIIPNLNHHVQQHVLTCPDCQLIKADKHCKRGLLTQLYLPKLRWHSVSMDWMSFERYPKTIGTTVYDAVLVFVYRGTKMVHLVPTSRRTTADNTAQLFIKYVIK